jgi:hypothetical protein
VLSNVIGVLTTPCTPPQCESLAKLTYRDSL